MRKTLLLRFAAPLQSWGLESKFTQRGTEREPTKSGVVGFLAAALGRRREEDLSDLTNLKFGVRIDQPGQLLVDFHTAKTEMAQRKDASENAKKTGSFITHRRYLADAVFLVGLESEEEEFLRTLEEAVKSPVFPLYLGRRSCPPTGSLVLGIRDSDLRKTLAEEPWYASNWYRRKMPEEVKLTIACDAENPGLLTRRDFPLSFSQAYRRYDFRSVDDVADAVIVQNLASYRIQTTDHDVWGEVN